jgi:hypothetical protein
VLLRLTSAAARLAPDLSWVSYGGKGQEHRQGQPRTHGRAVGRMGDPLTCSNATLLMAWSGCSFGGMTP